MTPNLHYAQPVELVTLPSRADKSMVRLAYAFAFIVLALGIAGGGSVVRYLYPVFAVGIAYHFYRKAPVLYISFVCWLWFLSPFLRRIVDYRSGWMESNPILLAAPAATLVCFPSLYRYRGLWRNSATFAFQLAIAAAAYGFIAGGLQLPKKIVLIATIDWFAPLIFGFHVFAMFSSDERVREVYRKSLVRTLVWGVLIVGMYGVIQLVFAPPWDQFWMLQSGLSSIGSPEPFAIRVFSTLNGPGVLGGVLAVGLLAMVGQRTVVSKIAMAAGYASLLLCLVRAAWLTWMVGTVLIAIRQRKYAMQLLGAVALFGAIIGILITTVDPIRDTLQTRLQSLTSVQDDNSYQQRQAGSVAALNYVATQPFGKGLGAPDFLTDHLGGLGSHDSEVWELLLSLGWIMSAVYVTGLAIGMGAAFRAMRHKEIFYVASGAIVFGIVAEFPLGSVTLGLPGIFLWTFVSICLALPKTPSHESAESLIEA